MLPSGGDDSVLATGSFLPRPAAGEGSATRRLVLFFVSLSQHVSLFLFSVSGSMDAEH